MKLIFNEIVINQLVVDEDLFKEYLENCKDNKISPEKDDFIDWVNETTYIGDLIADSNYKYTLNENQFNDYLNTWIEDGDFIIDDYRIDNIGTITEIREEND